MNFRLFWITILFSCAINAQNKIIDSLTSITKTQISDSLLIKTYGDLCWFYGNVSIDSAFYYGNLALDLSKKTTNITGEAQAYNDLGILHYKLADFNKSITFYKHALKLRIILQDTLGVGSLYNKMGISYQRIFKMDSALYFNTKALDIYENVNNVRYAALIKNNIANIYSNLKQYQKALDEHLECAEIRTQINDLFGLTYSFTNIGNSYLFLKDTVQSLVYYKKGIEIAEKNNFENELSTLYNNYGAVLKNQNLFDEAIEMYTKSYELRKKLNDNYGITSVLLNIGDLYLSTGKINQAEEKLRQGLDLAKKTAAIEHEMNAYKSLLLYFAYIKNTDSILYYHKLSTTAQDIIFNSRVTKEVAEIQEKYDTAQREKEIAQQKEQLLQNELQLKNKNLFSLLMGSGILILGVISFSLYKRQQLKRKEFQNKLALREAQTYNKLQYQRHRISRDLHDNIGSQLTFIISSIDNLMFLTKNSNERFRTKLAEINEFAINTISQLRDTIWAMNKQEISFEDFQGRIISFIEKAKTVSNNIQFNFKPDIKSAITFSSIKGITVFRVIQEAINNSLKHANASEISVHIYETKNNLFIEVMDNGKGFELNTVESGNGLENMQKRIDEIKGEFSIQSEINKGTSITISCLKNKTNAV